MPIALSDIGLVGRNVKLFYLCSGLIPLFFDSRLPYLDYGGGNGMFVRMMRDRGFDFYWHDKFSSNQFAAGFEASPDMKFSALTAFEVFEHLPKPLEAIEDMMHYSASIIFSTRLLPYWKITPEDWWYFTPDTGQHVSFYSRESLEFIARKFNMCFSTNGISVHIFSTRTVPGIVLKLLSLPSVAQLISGLVNIRRKSYLEEDYYRLTGRGLS